MRLLVFKMVNVSPGIHGSFDGEIAALTACTLGGITLRKRIFLPVFCCSGWSPLASKSRGN